MPLSEQDRDLATRTIIGEAGDQPPEGQAAVAHVILNRLFSGDHGKTASDVVLERGQFEPWQTRAKELAGIRKTSLLYQRVAKIVDAAESGEIADPTGGATHFLDPAIVRSRRGGSLPDWAQGEPVATIGSHAFYAPNRKGDAVSAINSVIGSLPSNKSAMAFAEAPGSLFRGAGFDVPASSAGAPAPVTTAVTPEQAGPAPGSLFKSAGFALPTDAPVARPVDPSLPNPQEHAADIAKYGVNGLTPEEVAKYGPDAKVPLARRIEEARKAIDLPTKIWQAAENIPEATKENYNSASALMHSGVQDFRAGNRWPSFPSADPQSWGAGGALKTAAGALGAITSPIAGTINAMVEQPVTQLTGNPEIGSRAGAMAGLFLPSKGTTATAKALAPSTRATNELVNAIGPENVPAAVARLRANPRLSVMDVSDPVRTMAQGLIDPAQPRAQNILTQAVKERINSAPAAINAAYTQAMGTSPDVMRMVEGLKARARDAGQKAIEPALENAKPVNVTPVIEAIDKELKPGLQALADPGTKLPLSALQQELVRFRQQLTDGNSLRTDPKLLHRIQSDIGDLAFQMSKSPEGKTRLDGSKLRSFNEKLIDVIDDASGGAYRPAREKFKDAKDIHEAFDAGFDTLKNRQGVSGLEDRPEALRDWMKAATPEEVVARRLGTRADIDQKIRGVKNQALAGTNITSIEYNRDKLQILFGKEETARLVRTMNDAKDEALTNAKLLANSKTAETLAGQKALEVRKVGGGNPLQYIAPVAGELLGQSAGLPIIGGAGVMAAGALHRGAQFINKQRDIARNTAFARAASSVGAGREQTINALLAHPKVVRQLQKSGNALTVP